MKKRVFAITSLLAAGFFSTKADAAITPETVLKKAPEGTIFDRLRLQHLYTLAGHRSHSSHSSHSSHRSSTGGGYVSTPRYYDPSPTYVQPNYPPAPQPAPQLAPAPLLSAPSPSYAPAPKVLPGNTDKFRQIVIQVQTAMSLYGYYDGEVDGRIGPQSRVALAKMQEAFGLKVTGTVTPEVLDKLGIAAQ